MEMKLREIAELLEGTLVGDPDYVVRGIATPESFVPGQICIVWEENVLKSLAPDIPLLTYPHFMDGGRVGVAVKEPRAALIHLLAAFDERRAYTPHIHESSVIAKGCVIGRDVYIGPHCILSEGSRIGDGSSLQGNVTVGRNAVIGADCQIDAGVVLQDDVWLGDRVIIHSNSVLGSDGFGFIQNEEGRRIRIPQIGGVVIEDDVEIGAFVTIDRATFGETRIAEGTKIGNHVQIAHNSKIGKDCIFVGFIAMGGSVTIGDGSLIAGFTGVADHVQIEEGVTVAGYSGVTKGIKKHETVSGFPAQNHRQEQRFQAALRRVPEMGKKLKELEKQFRLLEMGR